MAKTLAAFLGVFVAAQSLDAAQLKPRLVVLTDIAPGDREPDDQESLVRLLVYADRSEIEGLIACSGWNNSGHTYPVAWLDILKSTIDAHRQDLPNLMKRSGQTNFLSADAESQPQALGYWPSPAYLHARTMEVPADAAGKTFQVICEVTDNGTPNLTSYRRIIFEPTTGTPASNRKNNE